ncbi:MAG: hypothetical protein SGPRY_005404, partial [Prymnesium sp.]
MSVASSLSAQAALRWLRSLGVSPSRLVAGSSSSPSAGVGLSAAHFIPSGELIVSIPREAWWPLSAEAARQRAAERHPSMVERVDRLADSLTPYSTRLADSTLMAAAVAQEAFEESSSPSYLRELRVDLDLPVMWPAQLRLLLLQGTSCHRACASQASLSDQLFDAISE